MFDPATGLPARIRTHDYDNIWGDVTYDVVLADWMTYGGVKVATTRRYELNGRTVAEVKLTDVQINRPVAVERFGIPAAFITGAPKPATGPVPFQWVIRRQFIGSTSIRTCRATTRGRARGCSWWSWRPASSTRSAAATTA
jgi:hypothetical protein